MTRQQIKDRSTVVAMTRTLADYYRTSPKSLMRTNSPGERGDGRRADSISAICFHLRMDNKWSLPRIAKAVKINHKSVIAAVNRYTADKPMVFRGSP